MKFFNLYHQLNEDRSGGETPGERWAREMRDQAAERDWGNPAEQQVTVDLDSSPGTSFLDLFAKAMHNALGGEKVRFYHNAGDPGIGKKQAVILDRQSAEMVYTQLLKILEPYTQEVTHD
jgi:hypothetical protein